MRLGGLKYFGVAAMAAFFGMAGTIISGDVFQFSGGTGDCKSSTIPNGTGFILNGSSQIVACVNYTQVTVITPSTFAAFVQNVNAERAEQLINSHGGTRAQTGVVWRNHTSTAAKDFAQMLLNGSGVSDMNGPNAMNLATLSDLYIGTGGCVYLAACATGTPPPHYAIHIDPVGQLFLPQFIGGSDGCLKVSGTDGGVSVVAC